MGKAAPPRRPAGISIEKFANRNNPNHYLEKKRLAKETKRKATNIYRRIAERVEKEVEKDDKIKEFQQKMARIEASAATAKDTDSDFDNNAEANENANVDVEMAVSSRKSQVAKPPTAYEEPKKKLDPLQKAAAEFAAKKARLEKERQQRAKEREEALKRAKERKRERYATNQKLSQRTSKGQPIMNHIVQHLLDKIQKQDAAAGNPSSSSSSISATTTTVSVNVQKAAKETSQKKKSSSASFKK